MGVINEQDHVALCIGTDVPGFLPVDRKSGQKIGQLFKGVFLRCLWNWNVLYKQQTPLTNNPVPLSCRPHNFNWWKLWVLWAKFYHQHANLLAVTILKSCCWAFWMSVLAYQQLALNTVSEMRYRNSYWDSSSRHVECLFIILLLSIRKWYRDISVWTSGGATERPTDPHCHRVTLLAWIEYVWLLWE